ncbi:MAG: hypothetical protein ACK41T_03770 [Pseudobdellovibrio sp.]
MREAIVLDGSANNLVISNLFYENFGGGVHLYKNCWESSNYKQLYQDKLKKYKSGLLNTEPAKPLAQFPRRQRAEKNTISGNVFVGGSIGVALGRRQWAIMRRTHPTNKEWAYCGDKPFASGKSSDGSVFDVIRDYANSNTVSNNRFINTSTGILLADGQNEINENKFIQNESAIAKSSNWR